VIRGSLWPRPPVAHQSRIRLEPEIVMEALRCVLLHDESSCSFFMRPFAGRFRGPAKHSRSIKEPAFAPCGGEGGERSEPDEGVLTHIFKAAARV
jgi:hypothetical protein